MKNFWPRALLALLGGDLLLEQEPQLLGIHSVRDVLQRGLEERITDPLRFALEREQALLARLLGDGTICPMRPRLGQLALDRARQGLDGDDMSETVPLAMPTAMVAPNTRIIGRGQEQ